MPQAAAGGGKDFNEAWNILHTPAKVDKADELTALLASVGLTEASDLEFAELEDLQKMAVLLQPLGAKKFKALLQLP